ncbi:actin family [Piptocephalis cylindrospora]|uniref:Actin-like protein ARP6 n=1 Tax=Piptocephalis cylindrospora TaxID=1907219 RepID=A0A4P9Y5B5_9FUNG|nr:actin family [Piptocephalis cylindrospora]|eukprot:RKP14133.1 actin family [Piptocephalis cylindrospora]
MEFKPNSRKPRHLMSSLTTLALDNGAGSVRAGFIHDTSSQPIILMWFLEGRVLPNVLGRIPGQKSGTFLVGDQVAHCKTYAGMALRRPHDRGILVDWDAERIIWDRLFSPELLNVTDASDIRLLLTEPPLNLPNVRQAAIEVALEERGFAELALAPGTWFAAKNDLRPSLESPKGLAKDVVTPEAMVIVDCGFSSTHIVPMLHGRTLYGSIKRINVGGKLLTNYLKQTISFRQWNMMDETLLVNHVKEKCCYVAQDYPKEMDRFKYQQSTMDREYVLPDFVHRYHGYIRGSSEEANSPSRDPADQVLKMGNEQIQIPEILFHPNDIGIQEAGLAESIALSINVSPPEIQSLLWSNIVLVGGNFNFPGFHNRLQMDLESYVPQGTPLGIHLSDRPESIPWKGMKNVTLHHTSTLQSITLTKAAWEESGMAAYDHFAPHLGLYV